MKALGTVYKGRRAKWAAPLLEAHKMPYAGVDAHRETSQITVMDEDGKALKSTQVESSRRGLEALGQVATRHYHNPRVPGPTPTHRRESGI